jgi:outer membrane protein OmpA-like peptidoglycan-associated protein
MLKNFPEWRLRIVGHTDATGDPEHNEALSLERANAIMAALVERGVDAQRLAAAGSSDVVPQE